MIQAKRSHKTGAFQVKYYRLSGAYHFTEGMPTLAGGLSPLSPAPPDPRKVRTTATHPLSMEDAGRAGEREWASLADPQDSECP